MNGNKPNLTLNMDDKIYLAVAKQHTEKLAFVYTLACVKSNKASNMYNMYATAEIHAFKNKDSAQLYYDTVNQIVNVNTNDESKNVFFEMNEKLIEQFLTKTK